MKKAHTTTPSTALKRKLDLFSTLMTRRRRTQVCDGNDRGTLTDYIATGNVEIAENNGVDDDGEC